MAADGDMYEQQLGQLIAMGAAGARAKAALQRSKGDLMGAAERVFAGEYDHLPSDDDATPSGPMVSDTGLATPGRDLHDSDADSDSCFDDSGDGYDDDDATFEMDASRQGLGSGADPYAGIFFSKDRTEIITEIQEHPIEYSLVIPPASSTQSLSGNINVVSLTRGEWMSGCPEGNEQSFLFQLYELLDHTPIVCPWNCGAQIQRETKDFFSVFPDFSMYIQHVKSNVRKPCPECQGLCCLACGERLEDGRGQDDKRSTLNAELYHCANLQGVILGVALNMVERIFEESNSCSRSWATRDVVTNKKRKSGYDDGSLAYTSRGGKSAAKGTGYSGAANEDTSGQKAALAAQKMTDAKLVQVLRLVRPYLPCLNREGGQMTSDIMVHPTSLAHLRRRSSFINTLLRNDSLLDMSNREELYEELFNWLEVVSNHESLASMLAMPQMRISGAPLSRLEPIPASARSKFDPISITVTYEGAPSPRELLENIVIQAQAAIKGLAQTKISLAESGATEEEGQRRMTLPELQKAENDRVKSAVELENLKLLAFCEHIIATAFAIDRSLRLTKGDAFIDRLKASLPNVPESGSVVAGRIGAASTDDETISTYVDWATKVRFQYCDMLHIGETDKWRHAFSNELRHIATANAPKRSLAIAKELAMLTTNLPVSWHSTIFLRVDETRVDCIKALIIGPEDTPYENGCFLFDICLPLDYNQRSPRVKMMTTNGGKYRFNPNLYADGKVCLSLLGTWSGPGWVAGQSTLLQVLISIQSLILNNEPYLNEPGWSSSAGSDRSKDYSANVRRMTVSEAMVNSIKKPPFPFAAEVHTHFRLKAKCIRKQMDRWIATDDGKGISNESLASHDSAPTTVAAGQTPLKRDVLILTDLLDKLERGEIVDGKNL